MAKRNREIIFKSSLTKVSKTREEGKENLS